ncbi:MAG: hypothetical protein AAGI30_11790 [Planctomycetota bacterium]
MSRSTGALTARRLFARSVLGAFGVMNRSVTAAAAVAAVIFCVVPVSQAAGPSSHQADVASGEVVWHAVSMPQDAQFRAAAN